MFTAHRRGSNERHFINYELMRQLQDDGRQYPGADNSGMLDNDTPESFNTRFTRLKDESGLSFEALSDEIYKATGVRVTNAALHKYTKGGNIDEPTLEALAAYFGKTPA